jgi:regulator of cell morphogenesis and NO signaling
MNIYKSAMVGEIAAAVPGALQIFQELKIDFCCGGKNLLADALAERGVGVEEFFARATARAAERWDGVGKQDFAQMSPAVLTVYIEDTHHEYLRHALPEIDELLVKVLKAHGRNHLELFEVYKLFGRLKSELTQHLVKEETLLFPAMAQGASPAEGLAAEIFSEHEGAGELLEGMRSAAIDYKVPEDACATYRRVYQLLPELEGDLHQHIHLENNILLRGLLP